MSDDDAEDLSDDVELVEDEMPQVAASEHDMIMMARALIEAAAAVDAAQCLQLTHEGARNG